MSVYVQLLHGRCDPNQDMDNWGFAGPRLGPFEAVHFTYMTDIVCFLDNSPTNESINLCFVDGLLLWEGAYYGDFEITSTG